MSVLMGIEVTGPNPRRDNLPHLRGDLLMSHACPERTVQVETKFLRLFRAVELGDDIGGWQVCRYSCRFAFGPSRMGPSRLGWELR